MNSKSSSASDRSNTIRKINELINRIESMNLEFLNENYPMSKHGPRVAKAMSVVSGTAAPGHALEIEALINDAKPETINKKTQALNIQSEQYKDAVYLYMKLVLKILDTEGTKWNRLQTTDEYYKKLRGLISDGNNNNEVKIKFIEETIELLLTRCKLIVNSKDAEESDKENAQNLLHYIEQCREKSKQNPLNTTDAFIAILKEATKESVIDWLKPQLLQTDKERYPAIEEQKVKESNVLQGPRQKTLLTKTMEQAIQAIILGMDVHTEINARGEYVIKIPRDTMQTLLINEYAKNRREYIKLCEQAERLNQPKPQAPSKPPIIEGDIVINYTQAYKYIDFGVMEFDESILQKYYSNTKHFQYMYPANKSGIPEKKKNDTPIDVDSFIKERKELDPVENTGDLLDAEKRAIHTYTTNRYKELNALLRFGSLPRKDQSSSIQLEDDRQRAEAFKEALPTLAILIKATNKKAPIGLYLANDISEIEEDIRDDHKAKATMDSTSFLKNQKLSTKPGIVLINTPPGSLNYKAYLINNKSIIKLDDQATNLSIDLKLSQTEHDMLMNSPRCTTNPHKLSRFVADSHALESYRQQIDSITNKVINHIPAEHLHLLHFQTVRGMTASSEVMKNKAVPEIMNSYLVNGTFTEDAMTSTSTSVETAKNFAGVTTDEKLPVMLYINNANEMDISSLSAYPGEEEILKPGQTQYLVTDVKETLRFTELHLDEARPVLPYLDQIVFNQTLIHLRELLIAIENQLALAHLVADNPLLRNIISFTSMANVTNMSSAEFTHQLNLMLNELIPLLPPPGSIQKNSLPQELNTNIEKLYALLKSPQYQELTSLPPINSGREPEVAPGKESGNTPIRISETRLGIFSTINKSKSPSTQPQSENTDTPDATSWDKDFN